MNILCGDIGGTNARLAILRSTEHSFEVREERVYKSRESPSLEAIISQFLDSNGATCEHACFGIAGPVMNGRCQTTNLPWIVDAVTLTERLRIQNVHLLNDLEANAYGISVLGEDDFVVLNEGNREAEGNQAIISAGTGLGEAALFWDGQQYHPFAGEGGHGNFGPANELQSALLNYLFNQYEHVSWERVLSGPGLLNIYKFLCEYRSTSPTDTIAEQIQEGDPAAVIAAAGLSGDCEICSEALNLFVFFYGVEAGDLALTVMATSGVYIGGGIAPKIITAMKGPQFMDGFLNKGRMRGLMETIPVKVIRNDKTALLGTAQYIKTIDSAAV